MNNTEIRPGTLYKYVPPGAPPAGREWLPLQIGKIYHYPEGAPVQVLASLGADEYSERLKSGDVEIEYTLAGDADIYGEAFQTMEPRWSGIIPQCIPMSSAHERAEADALFSSWQEHCVWLESDSLIS